MDAMAYCMGLFDGEGCITVSVSDKGNGSFSYGLRVSVQMNSETPIRFLHTTLGGSVYERRAGVWVWQLGSQASRPFLLYAAEHSLVKKRQAEIALLLSAEMGRYLSGESRKGINLHKGERAIDHPTRMNLVRALRSLNGARQRYTVT